MCITISKYWSISEVLKNECAVLCNYSVLITSDSPLVILRSLPRGDGTDTYEPSDGENMRKIIDIYYV